MAQQIYLQLGPPPFPLLSTLFNVGKIEEKVEEVVEGGGRGETLKKKAKWMKQGMPALSLG